MNIVSIKPRESHTVLVDCSIGRIQLIVYKSISDQYTAEYRDSYHGYGDTIEASVKNLFSNLNFK